MIVEISVIVPVYNAEKYIHKCISSILTQTFQKFELLLIDDGSTDNSGQICDDYAKKDGRVRVFHKDNGGVSSARNIGIMNAKGVYSIQIDADDWCKSDMLQQLYAKALLESADMVMCDIYTSDSQNNILYIKQQPTSLVPDDIIYDMSSYLCRGLCNKLIRHSFFKDNNIMVPSEISYGEDYITLIRLLKKMSKICYINEAFYYYRHNGNSITHKIGNKLIDDKVKLYQMVSCELKGYYIKNLCLNRIAYDLLNTEFSRGEISSKEFRCKYGIYKKDIISISDLSVTRIKKILILKSLNGHYLFYYKLYKCLCFLKNMLK